MMDGRVIYYYGGGGHCCPLVKSLGLWSHFALGMAAAHKRRDVLAHAFGLLKEICEEPEPAGCLRCLREKSGAGL